MNTYGIIIASKLVMATLIILLLLAIITTFSLVPSVQYSTRDFHANELARPLTD